MQKRWRWFFFPIVALVMVFPPGVYPCWVLHFGPSNHHHYYLGDKPIIDNPIPFEPGDTSTAPAVPQVIQPLSIFLTALSQSNIWNSLPAPVSTGSGWIVQIESPPPKA
jgi:hypothetical protein